MRPDISDVTRGKHGRPTRPWRRALVELAAPWTAVAVAGAMANLVAHGPDGPLLLGLSAAALLATAGFHVRWSRRHRHAPPAVLSEAPVPHRGARGPAGVTPAPAAPAAIRVKPSVRSSAPSAAHRSASAALATHAATAKPLPTPSATKQESSVSVTSSVPAPRPPAEPSPTAVSAGPTAAPGPGPSPTCATLWRLRTTVRDAPGSLAVLCAALAERGIDILSLQTHPLADGTVDEFLLRAPAESSAADTAAAVSGVGGRDTWMERADAHELVDAPARALDLAARAVLDPAELPLALRRLLGRCTIRTCPSSAWPPLEEGDGRRTDGTAVVAARSASAADEARARAQPPSDVQVTAPDGPATPDAAPVEGVLDGTVLRLRAPEWGAITAERSYLPFTPAEFARVRALVELDARLGPRAPRGSDVPVRPRAVTVREAGTADLAAAMAMHHRCSAHTLGMRYHGPVRDADRHLDHLLGPRFGQSLAARTDSGRIVALGHLLWDGSESEVALLVEDAWQRRGIGRELLGRLVAMALAAGSESVYAVTRESNSAMVATMRGLGLPLDYQVEEGTLVVTARLDPAPPAGPAPVQVCTRQPES